MKRTFSNTHLALTVLCAAVLTACGGGDSNFLGPDSQHNNFGGNAAKPLDPINHAREPVDKFLVSMTTEGKQTKNIAVSVDDDGDGKISYGDAVRFNQPGAVSCIVGGSNSGSAGTSGTCGSLQADNISSSYEKAVTQAKDKKTSAEQSLKDAEQVLGNARKDNTASPALLAELQKTVDLAKAAIARAEADLKKAENDRDTIQRQLNVVSMLDVNNVLHLIGHYATIDREKDKYSEFLSHDVGLRKIDAERKVENGQSRLYNYGGSISRAYNGVILFAAGQNYGANNNGYVDIYLREPAATGWSYNTFGAFSSGFLRNARDVNIGYQSIGKHVEDLPSSGTAKYLGIAHAYINDIEASRYSQKANSQVTMDVEINADFGKRSLGFDTRNTYIHTYEGANDQHIIQARPDLNLHGSAGWNQGVGDFKGQLRNEGGNLTGSIEGSFYGPKAAEVGGVFGLSGDDKEAPGSKTYRTHYVGGFGAKRD